MFQYSKVNIYLLSFIVYVGFLTSAPAQLAIRNGVTLPASDTLWGLIVFAEVDYSMGPCPNNLTDPYTTNWARHLDGTTSPPPMADKFFDQYIDGDLGGYITEYYHQASFGKYVIMGDYLPEVVSVPCNKIQPYGNGLHQVLSILKDKNPQDTTLYTQHGFPLNRFDQWTITKPGEPKVKKPDGKIDLIYIIWKNNRYIAGYNTGDNAGYGVSPAPGIPFKNMKGVNNVTSYLNAFSDNAGFHITVAEHLHGIFGGNNWHSGGGRGIHTFLATPYNYGVTAQLAATMQVVCGWDRWMMYWQNPKKKYLTSACDEYGNEINTENFSQEDFPGGGTFLLRDFVTTGDAVRIKLPYINWTKKGDIKNQYLWLEYHAMNTRYDQYYVEDCADNDNGKFPLGTPGLYAYIQVGKDQREGGNEINSSSPADPNALASWLLPVTAEGNFDFTYRWDKVHPGAMICGSWNNRSLPVDKTQSTPNPFTGYSDLFRFEDTNHDGILYSGDDLQPGLSVMLGDSVWFNYHCAGDWMDAFSFATGHTKLSISTNPAPVPVYTYAYDYERNIPYYKKNEPGSSFENRTIWLNGLSIEILDEQSAVQGENAIRIKIRWDDFHVSSNVRWCGNIVQSPHPFMPGSPSLVLEKRKTILIDRSHTPIQHLAYPLGDEDGFWFSDTTVYTLLSGAVMELNEKSSVILASGSRFILEKGSILRMKPKSKLVVNKGCELLVKEGAVIERDKNAKIIYK